jgi:hypothetical protein
VGGIEVVRCYHPDIDVTMADVRLPAATSETAERTRYLWGVVFRQILLALLLLLTFEALAITHPRSTIVGSCPPKSDFCFLATQ